MSAIDLSRESLDREFPSRAVAVQLDHAAVSPIPRVAAEAMAAYGRRLSTHGGIDWRAWDAEADRLRALGARILGAGERAGGAASVSIVCGTASALNLVANALDWKAGDVVVTTESEFPANLTPWLGLARFGVEVRRVPTRDGAFTAADVAARCDARTRLVALSAVGFHTGFLAPVAEVAAFCRPRGILLGVDAIQAVGAAPVDVEAWDVDYLAADGHKWMLGPEGCGLLYTRPELRARLHAPGGWKNLRGRAGVWVVPEVPEYQEDARKLEPGALPTPGLYALAASLELLLGIGQPRIGERIAACHAALIEELPRAGWTPILFEGELPRSGILAARPPDGASAQTAARALAARGFVVSARQGFLRFAPHVSIEPDEARAAAAELRRV